MFKKPCQCKLILSTKLYGLLNRIAAKATICGIGMDKMMQKIPSLNFVKRTNFLAWKNDKTLCFKRFRNVNN